MILGAERQAKIDARTAEALRLIAVRRSDPSQGPRRRPGSVIFWRDAFRSAFSAAESPPPQPTPAPPRLRF
jgi:hypothetical protein